MAEGKLDIKVFKSNCEQILKQYENLETYNYKDFVNICDLDYHLRRLSSDEEELQFFTCCIFQSVQELYTHSESSYYRVGSFYLLYVLYYNQPSKDRQVKLQFTLQDFLQLKLLIKSVRARHQMDFLYIFAKLKSDHAFHYVAHHKELTFMDVEEKRATVDESRNTVSKISMELNDFLQQSHSMQQLKQTQDKYKGLLKTYLNKHTELPNFMYDNEDIVDKLKKTNT